MMRLPAFEYRAPTSVTQAAEWLAEAPADTMLLAGGTDLLPKMKRRQQVPKTLIALRSLRELRAITSGVGSREWPTALRGRTREGPRSVPR